jgi:curved DNA-binding protein CbpA
VALDFIDASSLVEGLTHQMISNLLCLFLLNNASFEFYDDINLITEGSSELISLDAYFLLMSGIRHNAPSLEKDMNKVINTLRNKAFILEDIEYLPRYKFSKSEKQICQKLLNESQTLEKIKNWGNLDLLSIKTVLYVLLLTKQIKIGNMQEDSKKNNAVTILESVAPDAVTGSYPPQILELRKQIEEKAVQNSSLNYYQMLGIQNNASEGEIRKAYFKLVKIFHPDRSSKQGFGDLRDTLAYIFANLSEAHNTLNDIDKREAYDLFLTSKKVISKEEEEEIKVREVLSAESSYQKALVFLRQEKYQEAHDFLKIALDGVSNESEYVALDAYRRFKQGEKNLDRLIEILREAKDSNPKSWRIHFYFGIILKANQRIMEARNAFQKVVDLSPHNIEAAREIRLIDMRRKNSGKQKKPGFWKKIKSK